MILVRIPAVGSVISYSYLWKEEHEKGQIEGLKLRPCVVMVVGADGGELVVAPITHSPTNTEGIELNHALKRRLGLDDEKSWLILTEVNIFRWRGPDVVIPPFLTGCIRRIHAAIFSFMAGVMPPMPRCPAMVCLQTMRGMFGRSLL
jgi:hypothetical protein